MKQLLLILLLVGFVELTYAQSATNDTLSHTTWNFRQEFPKTINKKRLKTIVYTEGGMYVAGLAYMSLLWYKDSNWRGLTFFNDNTEWEQVDKFGHLYTSYQLGERGYYALRWAGVPKGKALLYGGTLGLIALTPVEVLDGFTDDYGFSAPDMLANTIGTALFIGQEALFDEQIIKVKWSYHFTDYPLLTPNQLGRTIPQRILKDYNGHTYWFSANLYSAFGKQLNIPKWLCISVGYGAEGMWHKFFNPSGYQGIILPYAERRPQYYLSVDVDLNKIPTRNRFLKKVFQQLNLLKIPAPALEWNRADGLRFHPFYF
ncbi:MAG: DUF2279 domain-containing protein [Spirosomataceae bacterium]